MKANKLKNKFLKYVYNAAEIASEWVFLDKANLCIRPICRPTFLAVAYRF